MRDQGPTTVWDLTGVQPGTYTATAFIADGKGCYASPRIDVEIED